MLLSLLIAPAIALSQPLDLYSTGPYEAGIPRPEALLGYELGSRITTFRDQERVVTAIADRAKAKVRTISYGKSVEGKPLRVFAISSAENIKRLDEIQSTMDRIANGTATPEQVAKTPAIVWINECIHGNEPASFESAMPLIYNLAASQAKSITGALSNVVVIVNPVYNPDGHERYAVWYNSVATGASAPGAYEQAEPTVIYGRTNHYRFDMNRDRISYSQDETRQEVAEFLKWHPQVYVDQHGQVDTYFFPPNPMSINTNVDRNRLNKWTDVFGKATAKAFDAKGYLYFARNEFDLYYPGYLDSFTSLSGAIGMTHETDGGKQLNKLRNDGTILTFRSGIDKHFTSALAVIRSAADNHKDLLASYASYKSSWTKGDAAGKFRRVVVTNPDVRPLKRLQAQLQRGGISSSFSTKAWTQPDAHDYWSEKSGKQEFPAGSLVIDIAQSQGALAKALLEPGSDFEPEFLKAQREKKKTAPDGETYPGPDGSEFYDLTGWSLVYAYNLKGWWCETTPKVATSDTYAAMSKIVESSPIGYAMPYEDQSDILATMDALRDGIKGLTSTKPMVLGDTTLPRGTFLFLAERNEEGYDKKLKAFAAKRGATLIGLQSGYPTEGREGPGSESVIAMDTPKVAVVFGRDGGLGDVGATWYLLEREFNLPFTPISENALNGDLSAYTAIIVPSGVRASGGSKLKEWVQSGGHLVVLENVGWALGSSGYVELDKAKEDVTALPGSLFRANLDPRSPLGFGYPVAKDSKSPLDPIEIAVPIAGNEFYPARKKGGSVISLESDVKKTRLLSGWTFGEETEKALAGTVWLQDAPYGRGHAILFTQDPTQRALWPGLYKLVLNAILFGG